MAGITSKPNRNGRLWRSVLAVPCCLLMGSFAQAQVCPNTGNPIPGGGGGVPQTGGTQVGLQQPNNLGGGGGGQFGAQNALQLVNLAQQAMQIQQLIHNGQTNTRGPKTRSQTTRPASKPYRTALLDRKKKDTDAKDDSRPLSRREKLIARLKQRKLDRARRAEEIRARRAGK